MRRLLRQSGLLMGLALLPAIGVSVLGIHRPPLNETESPGQILLADALQLRDKPLWLDVRPQEFYQAGHIPGALPLREDEWDDLLPAVLEAWNDDQPVILYTGGPRSHDLAERAAQRLRRDTGWSRIGILKGGYDTWRYGR